MATISVASFSILITLVIVMEPRPTFLPKISDTSPTLPSREGEVPAFFRAAACKAVKIIEKDTEDLRVKDRQAHGRKWKDLGSRECELGEVAEILGKKLVYSLLDDSITETTSQ